MVLNQKLEEILTANSQFQLKIKQLEIQLNSVTNFLKQQFGNDFVLGNPYLSADQTELVPTTSSFAKQQLIKKHNLRRKIGVANSTRRAIIKRRTPTKSQASGPSASSIDFAEQQEDHEKLINKVGLDELLEDIEQISRTAQNLLGNMPRSSGPIQQQGAAAAKRNMSKKRFTCTWPQCKQQFTQRQSLKRHLRTHTGEKPYVCDWSGCEKRFKRKDCLVRHRKAHYDEKPFSCAEVGCGKQYKQRGNLLAHQQNSHQSRDNTDIALLIMIDN